MSYSTACLGLCFFDGFVREIGCRGSGLRLNLDGEEGETWIGIRGVGPTSAPVKNRGRNRWFWGGKG